jgi:hypothetical protein
VGVGACVPRVQRCVCGCSFFRVFRQKKKVLGVGSLLITDKLVITGCPSAFNSGCRYMPKSERVCFAFIRPVPTALCYLDSQFSPSRGCGEFGLQV